MSKRIGIIGGLSPESTVEYYLYLTHTYTQRFGNSAYPEVLIYSVSFQSYADWPAHTLGAPEGVWALGPGSARLE
jgi:aspartate racemase